MPSFCVAITTSAAPEEVWKILYDPSRFPQRWAADGYAVASCLMSDLRLAWRLEPIVGGTRITVYVELPDGEAHRLDGQRRVVAASLARLAELSA
jgi:uncharacterized protein YndB with AHSA1/START domain